MRKIVSLLFLATLIACNGNRLKPLIETNLEVQENLVLKGEDNSLSLNVGNYELEMKIQGPKKIDLKVKNNEEVLRELKWKTKKALFDNDLLEQNEGTVQIDLSPDDANQDFGIQGTFSLQIESLGSENVSGFCQESCVRRICNNNCDTSDHFGDAINTTYEQGPWPTWNVECECRYEAYDCSYRYNGTLNTWRSTYDVDLILLGETSQVGSISGQRVKTYTTSSGTTECE